MKTHIHWLTLLLLMVTAAPITAQDEEDLSPYEIARQRIEETRINGATDLDLGGLGLRRLPPEIGELTNLKGLGLYDNHLQTLPSEIGNLVHLNRLYLNNNNLHNLPPEIGNLSDLFILNLNNNQLRNLPLEIRQLTNLTCIDIGNNQFTNLPTILAHTGDLSDRALTPNVYCLNHLPSSGYSISIPSFEFSGNPLIYPPQEIIEQGDFAILIFLSEEHARQQIEITQRNAEIKRLSILGASSIGLFFAVMLGYRLRRNGRKSKQKRNLPSP